MQVSFKPLGRHSSGGEFSSTTTNKQDYTLKKAEVCPAEKFIKSTQLSRFYSVITPRNNYTL
jgi:hypothetical protein